MGVLAAIEGISAVLGIGQMMYQHNTRPHYPAPAAPAAPPQSAQAPSVQNVKKAQTGVGQAGGAPGPASTYLTGSGGVAPMKLMLGKKTLLGS